MKLEEFFPSPITGAIFDCDGTLLDSIGAWLALEDELASLVGCSFSDEESTYVGTLTIPETAEYFHGRFGLGDSAEEVLALYNEKIEAIYRDSVFARPGALEFVRALHEQGIKTSIASSTPQKHLRIALGKNGFLPYLDAIVSVDDVGHSKRDPAAFDLARTLMGTPKESTWVFEDSVYALKTAINAGYRSVGVYDRDISGSLEELSIADVLITSFL